MNTPSESILDHETRAKLNRMRELIENCHLRTAPEVEATLAEYHALLAEMVPRFLPLVEQLVDAGLLTCTMEIEGGEHPLPPIGDYISLDAQPTEAFDDNGYISLQCEWDGEGNLNKKVAKRFLFLQRKLFVQ